jgi:hypothetical protein
MEWDGLEYVKVHGVRIGDVTEEGGGCTTCSHKRSSAHGATEWLCLSCSENRQGKEDNAISNLAQGWVSHSMRRKWSLTTRRKFQQSHVSPRFCVHQHSKQAQKDDMYARHGQAAHPVDVRWRSRWGIASDAANHDEVRWMNLESQTGPFETERVAVETRPICDVNG